MTASELIERLQRILTDAPRATPRVVTEAIGELIEGLQANSPAGESGAELEVLRALVRQCAQDLERAAAIRTSVMDSESRALDLARQRESMVDAVAERLRAQ